MMWFAVFVSICCCVYEGQALSGSTNVMRAKVVSCKGCRLNKLPEIKRFIFNSVPLYHNVEFEEKHGASPVLVMLNEKDEHIETIDLSSMTERECNEFLLNKGFFRKAHVAGQVPEKYLQGPYEGIKLEPQKKDL